MQREQEQEAAPPEAPSPEETRAKLEEFAERSLEGCSVADLFGLDDAALHELMHQAHTLFLDKNYEEAKTLLHGVTALDHEQCYAYFLLGEVNYQTEDYVEALQAFEMALSLDEEHPGTLYRLGEMYVRAGRLERGAELLERCLRVWDEDQEPPQRAVALLEHARAAGSEEEVAS